MLPLTNHFSVFNLGYHKKAWSNMGELSGLIKKHQVVAFFIIVFVISWGLWIPDIIITGGKVSLLIYAGGFGPFLSAIFVTLIVEKRPGLHKWFRRTFRFRINVLWYLLGALFLPIGVVLLQFGLYLFFGGQPDFSNSLPWWLYLINLPIVMLFAGGNEEPGWRGFALPKLLIKQNPLVASLIIGIIWAVWHIPIFFNSEWSGAGTSFVWFLANTVGLSLIMTWLYYKSSRSVFPVMLFHQATNIIWNYFPMPDDVLTGVDDFIVLKTIVYWTIAIVLIIVTKGHLSYQPELSSPKV
ncbi:CPBP family intramembrane glutamic endopeptidase [Chloroflexota bacterium]